MKHVIPDPDGSKNFSEQIAKLYFKSDFCKIVELHGFDSALKRQEEMVGLIDRLEKEKLPSTRRYRWNYKKLHMEFLLITGFHGLQQNPDGWIPKD